MENLVNINILRTDDDKALCTAILKECSSLTFYALA